MVARSSHAWRDIDHCMAGAEEITRKHGSCERIAYVTDPASVSALVGLVLAITGRLDVMVCNAGGSVQPSPSPMPIPTMSNRPSG